VFADDVIEGGHVVKMSSRLIAVLRATDVIEISKKQAIVGCMNVHIV